MKFMNFTKCLQLVSYKLKGGSQIGGCFANFIDNLNSSIKSLNLRVLVWICRLWKHFSEKNLWLINEDQQEEINNVDGENSNFRKNLFFAFRFVQFIDERLLRLTVRVFGNLLAPKAKRKKSVIEMALKLLIIKKRSSRKWGGWKIKKSKWKEPTCTVSFCTWGIFGFWFSPCLPLPPEAAFVATP